MTKENYNVKNLVYWKLSGKVDVYGLCIKAFTGTQELIMAKKQPAHHTEFYSATIRVPTVSPVCHPSVIIISQAVEYCKYYFGGIMNKMKKYRHKIWNKVLIKD